MNKFPSKKQPLLWRRPLLIVSCFMLGLTLIACQAESNNAIDETTNEQTHIIAAENFGGRNGVLNRIDLQTGERTNLWQAPEQAWIHQIAPIDNTSIGLSFSPAPAEGSQTYQRAGIYLLKLDADEPILLPVLESDQDGLGFFSPIWTSDGRYVFFVRYENVDGKLDVRLMRLEVANGSQIEIAKDGVWPRVSADNQYLTYISVNPETQDRGIVVTDIDGNNALELVEIGMYLDVDTPIISADNQYVYFAASLAGRKVSWLDTLLGVKTAFAHADTNIPLEWLRVPIGGGEHEQLSRDPKVIFFGALSTSDNQIYFSTTDGFFAMPANGGDYEIKLTGIGMRTFVNE